MTDQSHFNEVDSTLASFYFADRGLLERKLITKLFLRQTGLQPEFDQ